MKRIILLLLFLPVTFAGSTIFVAHSDDEIIGASNVLIRNNNVTVIVFTDGAPEEYNKSYADELLRKNEQLSALSLLNKSITIKYYDFDDLNFYNDLGVFGLFRTVYSITFYMNNHCSDTFYTHAYEAGHVDHDTVNFIVKKAHELSNCGNNLMEFTEYNPKGWGVPLGDLNNYTKIVLSDEEALLKMDMLSKFVSQDVHNNCTGEDYANLSDECKNSIINTYYFRDEYFRLMPEYDYSVSPSINNSWGNNFYNTLDLTGKLVNFYMNRWIFWGMILLFIILKSLRI